MAKDLEDGFTRIANEVLEDLAQCKFFCVKSRVVLAIIRNTWGWKGHPKERLLSQTYLAEATQASVDSIKRAMHELSEAGVIFRDGSMTGYNKNWPQGGAELPPSAELHQGESAPGGGAELPPNLVQSCTTKKEKKEKRKNNVTEKIAAEDIFLSDRMKQEAKKHGIPDGEVEKLFADFQGYNGDDSHTPYKWAFIWRRWCENQKARGGNKDGNQSVFDRVAEKFLRTVE